ncbi:MAG: hypothetical protein HGA69_00380 [Desulfobulbaceae bacterium]|nr:hypothetical protein [Desulfobulbaceae bacterium]
MGGSGSGRHYHYGSKSTTDDYRALDVRRLQRDGLLNPGLSYNLQWLRRNEVVANIGIRTEKDRINLSYRRRNEGEEWQDMNYPVYLEYTACNYGGRRAWFRCPAIGCGRRVAKLYSGGIFACRHCYRLAYESQREDAVDLMARRADKIRARLGWGAGILNPTGQKPKGMRWDTYDRLYSEYETFMQIALNGIADKFGFFKRRSE